MNDNRRVLSRWGSFLVWAAVAAAAAFWGLRLFADARGLPAHTQIVGAADAPRGDVARLLGEPDIGAARVAQAPAPSRYKLVGVITPRRAADEAVALALIAIDNKPAKAYRVGAVVEGNTVLREVGPRGASIGPRDGPATALELPPLAAAASSRLPPVGGPAATGAATLPTPVLLPPPPSPPSSPPNEGEPEERQDDAPPLPTPPLPSAREMQQ